MVYPLPVPKCKGHHGLSASLPVSVWVVHARRGFADTDGEAHSASPGNMAAILWLATHSYGSCGPAFLECGSRYGFCALRLTAAYLPVLDWPNFYRTDSSRAQGNKTGRHTLFGCDMLNLKRNPSHVVHADFSIGAARSLEGRRDPARSDQTTLLYMARPGHAICPDSD